MLNNLLARAATAWASKTMSNILISVIAVGAVAFTVWIGELRTSAARCDAALKAAERTAAVAEAYAAERDQRAQDAIDSLSQSDHACLDVLTEELGGGSQE